MNHNQCIVRYKEIIPFYEGPIRSVIKQFSSLCHKQGLLVEKNETFRRRVKEYQVGTITVIEEVYRPRYPLLGRYAVTIRLNPTNPIQENEKKTYGFFEKTFL